jgi:hypothetical protein
MSFFILYLPEGKLKDYLLEQLETTSSRVGGWNNRYIETMLIIQVHLLQKKMKYQFQDIQQ